MSDRPIPKMGDAYAEGITEEEWRALYHASPIPSGKPPVYRYRYEDNTLCRVPNPLSLRAMRDMGVRPERDHYEDSMWTIWGETREGIWEEIGPIPGALQDAVEVMEIYWEMPSMKHRNYVCEYRVTM